MHKILKGIVKGPFALWGADVTGIVINALIGIWIARQLPEAEYGVLVFIVALISNARLISSFGLGAKTVNDVARESYPVTTSSLPIVVSSLLSARLALAFAASSLFFAYSILANLPSGFLAGVLVFTFAMLDFCYSYLFGRKKVAWASGLKAIQPSVYAVGLLLVAPSTVYGVLQIWLVSALAIFALSASFCILHWTQRVNLNFFNPSRKYLKGSVKEIGSFFLLAIINQLSTTLPTIILGAIGSFEAAAGVGIMMSMVLILERITNMASWGWLLPSMRQAKGAVGEEHSLSVLEGYSWLVVMFGVPIAIVVFSWPDFLLTLLYQSKYAHLEVPLSIGALLVPAAALQRILGVGLIAEGQLTEAVQSRLIVLLFAASGPLGSLVIESMSPETFIMISLIAGMALGLVFQEVKLGRVGDWPKLLHRVVLITGGGFALGVLVRNMLNPPQQIHATVSELATFPIVVGIIILALTSVAVLNVKGRLIISALSEPNA